MKKKVSKLELYLVDYLVGKANKFNVSINDNNDCIVTLKNDNPIIRKYADIIKYSPTTNPSQAWPIIDREKINMHYFELLNEWKSFKIDVSDCRIEPLHEMGGKTSLESSMRCYVASIYGEEVEI